MKPHPSELTVITRAKDLCSYVMTVTQRSPKQFRITFTSRLQNLALNVIEDLYRANDVYLTRGDAAALRERLSWQRKGFTDCRLLLYIALLAMEQGSIGEFSVQVFLCLLNCV